MPHKYVAASEHPPPLHRNWLAILPLCCCQRPSGTGEEFSSGDRIFDILICLTVHTPSVSYIAWRASRECRRKTATCVLLDSSGDAQGYSRFSKNYHAQADWELLTTQRVGRRGWGGFDNLFIRSRAGNGYQKQQLLTHLSTPATTCTRWGYTALFRHHRRVSSSCTDFA